jgi:hypothetical protein
MGWRNLACGPIVTLVLAVCAFGVAEPNQPAGYVSRQEYEALRKQLEDLKTRLAEQQQAAAAQQQMQKELEDLKVQLARQEKAIEAQGQTQAELQRLRARIAQQEKALAAQEAAQKQVENLKAQVAQQEKAIAAQEQVRQETERLNQEVATARRIAERSGLGDTKLLITGSAAAGYFDPEGQSSTFTAEFNPMLLWQLNERLFFEGELELALEGPDVNGEGAETEAELDLAYLAYLLNDYVLLGAGKFSVPFTAYHNHLDPSWINKLPFDPLVYGDDGIAPDTGVGVFATGAFPCHKALFTYAAWLTNGPALVTENPESAGSLNFDNFNDLNNSKALGFRIAYLPFPQLEVAYSFEFSKPSPPGFETVRSTLHGVDLNYVTRCAAIQGQFTARGAWIWSNLGEATYDPTGALGFGPLRFDNDRNGGYAELAYRPTEVSERLWRNFEFALRYDRLDIPSGAPGGGTQELLTPGIDYWLTPRTLLKAAYAFDTSGGDADVFALQFATGF